MVTIKYFPKAESDHCETFNVNRVADFLREVSLPRDELYNLRFFKTDVLGEEINTNDGGFIDIDDGVIAVFDRRNIPEAALPAWAVYAIVAAVAAVAAYALTPRPSTPGVPSTSQRSSTNSLGASVNGERTNQRIDDIFGYVAKHMPPLWQVPYRIGINNQEAEVMLLCVGRGKYQIDSQRIYDGDTPYFRIPNAKANVYEPGTHPGKGSPSIILGGLVNQPIGIYRESNDLNASELLPPNDLTLGEDALWSIVESGGSATLTLTNAGALDVDLQDYFTLGSDLGLIDCVAGVPNGTKTLYYNNGTVVSSNDFSIFTPYEISGNYEITGVTSTTVTITDFGFSGVNSDLYITYYRGIGVTTFYTNDATILDESYYETYVDPTLSNPITVNTLNNNPDVGQVFDNIIGPISIYSGADKILINLTSNTGFYKIDGTTDRAISANVQVVIEELDNNGDPTGNTTVSNHTYSSNPTNTRYSVYQTIELNIPYTNARVYARRTTDRDKNNNITNVDKIEWTLLYSFEAIDTANIDFGDVTLMHVLVPSNSQSRLIKERKTNLDVTRKITQYLGSGNFGPTESYATDDAIQIAIHTALDRYCGRLTIDQINADNLLVMRQQIIDYFGSTEMIRFGFDFDDNQVAYDDMFIIIMNVLNSLPYIQNGAYDAFFERPQSSSTLQITHRNKIVDSEKRTDYFYRKYDGVELTFRNELTGVSEVIYIPTDRSAVQPERVELPGCITELQAYRRALRLYYKQIYHTFDVEFDVDEFGRMIVPGQRIDSPDGTRFTYNSNNTDGYRVYDGEVVEVNGLTVELSEPVSFVDGEDHYIQFTNVTGENSELILCTPGSDEFSVILSSTPSEAIYDGYDRDKTKFTFCSEQVRDSIALIPQGIESKIDNNKEINSISSINYDVRYYQGDLETP